MTLGEFFDRSLALLENSGIERPRSDIEWLLSATLNLPRLELYLHRQQKLTTEQECVLRDHLSRRVKREPLQYILGEVEFFNVRLKIDSRVLIPRPETEFLVAWTAEKLAPQTRENVLKRDNFSSQSGAFSILDLGTGSGAIAIALAKKFPESRVWAVDYSAQALEVARKNAELNYVANVTFSQSDWFSAINKTQRFNLIIANPPYLTEQEYSTAQAEVRDYEPKLALVSGEDGLADLEQIVPKIPHYLKPNGWCAIETGILHPEILRQRYGHLFRKSDVVQDLTKRDRFFVAYGTQACDS